MTIVEIIIFFSKIVWHIIFLLGFLSSKFKKKIIHAPVRNWVIFLNVKSLKCTSNCHNIWTMLLRANWPKKANKQTKIDRVFYSWINANTFECEPINNLTYSIHINHTKKVSTRHDDLYSMDGTQFKLNFLERKKADFLSGIFYRSLSLPIIRTCAALLWT